MKAGKYLAKPISWGLDKTKDDKPYVYVELQNDLGDRIIWKGYLSEKSQPFTVKALVTLGFQYTNLSGILEPDALDSVREVSIVVEEEIYEGKTYPKVKWINPTRKRMSREDSTKLLQGVDLAELFSAEYKSMGVEDSSTPF